MELHRIPLLRRILDSSYCIRRGGNQLEAGGELKRFIAVRHPDRHRALQALKKLRVVAQQLYFGMAVFALVGRADFSSQLVDHELQAVADAEDRQAKVQHLLVGGRGVGIVDGRRPTRQNNARGTIALDFFELGRAGENDGEDVLFADAAGDKLRILRAEVEDDDRLRFHHLLCQRSVRSVKPQKRFWLGRVAMAYPTYSRTRKSTATL